MNIKKFLSSITSPFDHKVVPIEPSIAPTDHYVLSAPSYQNAIDLIPGWNHAFPKQFDVIAGDAHLYNDDRIHWCLEQAGSIEGLNVLELGPLEGMHTYILSKRNPKQIDAIEANSLAFLRCLVSKEIFDLKNVSYWLGDFRLWLDNGNRYYDLTVASGVLYHSNDPLGLIRAIMQKSKMVYIWTHYFDDCLLSPDDSRGGAFSGSVLTVNVDGHNVALHERGYHRAWNDPKFCGGLQDTHYWMRKADIVKVIQSFGFDVQITHDDIDHPGGPAFSVFARQRAEVGE